jgi:hypothetical protein
MPLIEILIESCDWKDRLSRDTQSQLLKHAQSIDGMMDELEVTTADERVFAAGPNQIFEGGLDYLYEPGEIFGGNWKCAYEIFCDYAYLPEIIEDNLEEDEVEHWYWDTDEQVLMVKPYKDNTQPFTDWVNKVKQRWDRLDKLNK